jgi:hypothetical protein
MRELCELSYPPPRYLAPGRGLGQAFVVIVLVFIGLPLDWLMEGLGS